MIVTAQTVSFENATVRMNEGGKNLNEARGMGLDQIEELRKLRQEQIKKVNEAKGPTFWDSFGVGDFMSPERKVDAKTQEAFLDEMTQRLNKLEMLADFAQRMEKAGVKQEEAATKMAEAAKKLGIDLPNRGPSPSPVKP